MAKTTPITAEHMSAAAPLPVRPLAGTVSNANKTSAEPKNNALVQIRCTKAQAKAIKRAAVEAEMNISAYILSRLAV
jgi:hypothetical protein